MSFTACTEKIHTVTDKVILMVTDGPPVENATEIYSTIRTENAQLNNSVVIFTYGIGESKTETVYELISSDVQYERGSQW